MNASISAGNLVAGYKGTVVLDDVSFAVEAGGTLAILGRNGVGKSTLLNTLFGFTTRHSGSVSMDGQEIENFPAHVRNRMGLGYVPQEREIFQSLTVEENLAVALRPRGWPLAKVFEFFPHLAQRRRNAGNRLSGGEQQMLAIGRALAGAPKVLLLDEPMEGLAPIVVESLYDALAYIRDNNGPTIVLVEQKADLALAFAENAIVLDRGKIVYQGKSGSLQSDENLKARLLGLGDGALT